MKSDFNFIVFEKSCSGSHTGPCLTFSNFKAIANPGAMLPLLTFLLLATSSLIAVTGSANGCVPITEIAIAGRGLLLDDVICRVNDAELEEQATAPNDPQGMMLVALAHYSRADFETFFGWLELNLSTHHAQADSPAVLETVHLIAFSHHYILSESKTDGSFLVSTLSRHGLIPQGVPDRSWATHGGKRRRSYLMAADSQGSGFICEISSQGRHPIQLTMQRRDPKRSIRLERVSECQYQYLRCCSHLLSHRNGRITGRLRRENPRSDLCF